MKNRIYLLCIAMVLFTACGEQKKSPSAVSQKVTEEIVIQQETENMEEAETVNSATADFAHQGTQWIIRTEIVRECSQTSMGEAYVRVYNESDALVWQSGRVDGVGHDRYFLVSDADGESLLRYRPDPATGTPVYEFELFHLDADGQMVVDDRDIVEFTAVPSDMWNAETMYPAEKMESFAKHLNRYLKNGYLLLGLSEYGSMEYSTGTEKLTYEENYGYFLKGEGLPVSDNIAENISVYEQYLTEQSKRLLIDSDG